MMPSTRGMTDCEVAALIRGVYDGVAMGNNGKNAKLGPLGAPPNKNAPKRLRPRAGKAPPPSKKRMV